MELTNQRHLLPEVIPTVCAALDEVEVKYSVDTLMNIWIERESMRQWVPDLSESHVYDHTLDFLRSKFPQYQINWWGRTDQAMALDLWVL